MTAQAISAGRPLGYADSLIAATVLTHGLTVVTRMWQISRPLRCRSSIRARALGREGGGPSRSNAPRLELMQVEEFHPGDGPPKTLEAEAPGRHAVLLIRAIEEAVVVLQGAQGEVDGRVGPGGGGTSGEMVGFCADQRPVHGGRPRPLATMRSCPDKLVRDGPRFHTPFMAWASRARRRILR